MGVPKEMRKAARWVRYDAQKRPVDVSSGRLASVSNADTWATFEAVKSSPVGVGIGYVLGGNSIGCIDLDHCFQDGELLPWATEVLDEHPNAALVEVSRSGEGLHIFTELPDGPGQRIRDGRNIEVYPAHCGECDKGQCRHGRYIAITGIKYWRN
jgi:primase-polymerase (primpol)-like protein